MITPINTNGEYIYYPPNGVSGIFTITLNYDDYKKLEWFDSKGWEWKVWHFLVARGKIPEKYYKSLTKQIKEQEANI